MDELISRELAIDALRRVKPDFRWIPVTEKLPPNDTEVFVTLEERDDDHMFRYSTVGWCYNGFWVVDNQRTSGVLAWMRLPKPYKD